MEVIEKTNEGLSREFTVKVPASELDAKLTAKLEEMKGQVHLKGFRPGKAPVSFLKKMYGKSMMGELIQETMQEAQSKALTENEIQPAMAPHPHIDESKIQDVIEGKADLEYDIHVEVLPKFETMDVSGMELTKQVSEPGDGEINETLENIASQNKDWKARGKTAKAKDGDRVMIDFVGKIDGEEFEGGKGEGQPLELGSGRFIPGFEEQLVGVKTGEEKTVEVTFPEEYQATHLAGKTATFDVTVQEVQAPQEASVDDDFAKNLGFDDLEALKTTIKERLQSEYDNQSRMHLKRAILDKLDEAHDFELPKGMVDAEFDQIWRQVQQSELDDEDKDKSEDELKEEYRKIAERRVRLGLVLAEMGKAQKIEVPQDEMNRAFQAQAQQYGIPVQQLAEFYQQNPQAIDQLRAPIFEDKVIDYIIAEAKIEEKKVSKEELMKDPDDDMETASTAAAV